MSYVSRVTAVLTCSSWLVLAGPAQVRTPLTFEPNLGQASPEVQWLSRTPDRTLLLTRDEAHMVLKAGSDSSAIRMSLAGSNKAAESEGLGKLPSTSSYFTGTSRSEWRRGVPHFERVRYNGVYDGVDVVYYSSEGKLEYDFVLAPNADSSQIEMVFKGAERLSLNDAGDLVLDVNGRTLRQLRPKVYQVEEGARREVPASYRLLAGNRVKFALGAYDHSRELVIDPVLQYSTYVGDRGYDAGGALVTDANGDVYITGVTTSVRMPTVQTAQLEIAGDSDVFVAKFSSAGSLVWVTYLGGRRNDSGRDLAVDSTGNVYVVGSTLSTNFPVVSGPYTEATGEFDAFLTKISPDGRQFLFSTYLGGTGYDEAIGVAVNATGDAFVTGLTVSLDFPVRNGFQTGPSGGGGDIFVTKFSTTRFNVVYSTYIGGNGIDTATGIAVDSDGNAYISGGTTSNIFPVYNPIQSSSRGERDAFLLKLDPTGRSLVYSTFLGGSREDFGYRLTVDAQRATYVLGYTNSTDFPTASAFQTSLAGGFDAFVTKVNAAGSAIEYSTYLGGSDADFGFGEIAVDAGGSAYLIGHTASANFPTRTPFQLAYGGGKFDVFLTRLAPQGNSLVYSSLIGGAGDDYAFGLGIDPQGQVAIAGYTSSANFPQANNAFIGDNLGTYDVFLGRVSADASINFITSTQSTLTFSVRPGTTAAPQTITIGAGGAPLSITAQPNQPWLRATLDRNTTPATLTVSVDSATLPATPQVSGTINVSGPGAANTPLIIQVTVNQIVAPAVQSASPNPLTRDAANATVTLTGSGFQNGLSVRLNGSTQAATFVNGTTIQVIVPAAVRTTAQSLEFVVFNPDGTQSAPFTLPFDGGGTGIGLLPSGILNAATNAAGAIAPGEIILVYGTGFGPATLTTGTTVNGALGTNVGGVRLLIDGVPAPILYAKENQIAAIVPYPTTFRTNASVELEWQGQRSTPVPVLFANVSPGIFTVDSSGSGQASAVNQAGTPNSSSNPAAAGSVITIYGTGEGMLTPGGADGRIVTTERPVLPVNVVIGGIPVTPEFAGGSPGSYAGLLQVNVRIPAGLTGNVPVQLNVAGVLSQTGVTVAVR